MADRPAATRKRGAYGSRGVRGTPDTPQGSHRAGVLPHHRGADHHRGGAPAPQEQAAHDDHSRWSAVLRKKNWAEHRLASRAARPSVPDRPPGRAGNRPPLLGTGAAIASKAPSSPSTKPGRRPYVPARTRAIALCGGEAGYAIRRSDPRHQGCPRHRPPGPTYPNAGRGLGDTERGQLDHRLQPCADRRALRPKRAARRCRLAELVPDPPNDRLAEEKLEEGPMRRDPRAGAPRRRRMA